MARNALGGWLLAGAVLMAGVASSVGLQWPVAIDDPTRLLVVLAALAGWGVGYAVIAAFVVADAVRRVRLRDLDGLQRGANFVKVTGIWFFLANFVALTLLSGVAAGIAATAGYGLYGTLVIPLSVAATYLVFLPTSAYGIGCLVLMNRDGAIGRAFFGINLALHLLFIVDVISAVLVVEFARHVLGRTRTPSPLARNLSTGVVALGSILALADLILAVVALIVQPQHSALYGIVAVLLLAAPLTLILLVLVPVVPIITFRTAVRLYLLDDLDRLQRTTRNVKLVAIPLFIQNFLLSAAIVAVLTLFPVAASRGLIVLMGPLAVPIIGAFSSVGLVPTVTGTYLMLLVTSCYGVACVALLLRRQAVTKRYYVVNVILHLIFVADIASTLVVAHRARQILLTGAPPKTPGRQ